MKFCTHTCTCTHRAEFQAQASPPGALLKNYRPGKPQVLKSAAVCLLQMDREMNQKGKGVDF